MNLKNLIELKNKGQEYSKSDLKKIIMGYTEGAINDEDMTLFLKSIYDNGLSIPLTAELTKIMMYSGDTINLSNIPGIKVDKHSTGGVGDKVTLIVAPLCAALGAPVAKMSGRGLGFTGGTLDKLESIPGYNISLSEEQFKQQVLKHSIAVIGQTGNLVPADKKIYALRDETNLVASLPLISSSIMSKKLATGSDAILLDVKCGDAAFMKTQEEAEELARVMIDLGKHLNKDVRAEITSMETPLGRAIGNKIEVLEAVNALKGNWTNDLKEVCYSSAATILVQSKIFKDEEEAKKALDEIVNSGKALDKFKEWIKAQNGDVDSIFSDSFWKPKYQYEIIAEKNGYMDIKSAVTFGIVAMKLGAGREKKEDSIDYDAGIFINKKSGEQVYNGDLLFTLYSNKEINKKNIEDISSAFSISKKVISKKTLLAKLV